MRRHEGTPHTPDLRDVPGLRGCTDKQIAAIERLTDRSVVLPGRTLVREGTIGRELFVILKGSAVVTRRGTVVTTLGPGDYFGELGAIESGRRNATLTALSAVTVMIIGPQQLSSLMADVPGFRDALLRALARRLRDADDQIDRMAGRAGEAGFACEIRSFRLKRTSPTA
jgi:CRP-like cAMP-binding protein